MNGNEALHQVTDPLDKMIDSNKRENQN